MRKDRINIKAFAVANMKVLAVLALMVCNVISAYAQKHSLEFKGGVIATSTRNNGAGDAKTIMDYKPGLVVGGSFMWNFMDASLRAVAEGYYALQGEKYMMEDFDGKGNDMEFNSDISYFKLAPNVRYYAPYVPVYVGVGIYWSFATSSDVRSGDLLDQSHSWTFKKYYKPMDFGTRVALGTEIGVSDAKFVLEVTYESGLANISNRKERKIKNQSVSVSLGICFEIAGRHYRHF